MCLRCPGRTNNQYAYRPERSESQPNEYSPCPSDQIRAPLQDEQVSEPLREADDQLRRVLDSERELEGEREKGEPRDERPRDQHRDAGAQVAEELPGYERVRHDDETPKQRRMRRQEHGDDVRLAGELLARLIPRSHDSEGRHCHQGNWQ